MAACSACSSSSLLFTQWTTSSSEVFSRRGGRNASLTFVRGHGLHGRAIALPSKLWRRTLKGTERRGSLLSVNASTTSVQGIRHS